MRRTVFATATLILISMATLTQAQTYVTNSWFASNRMVYGVPNVPLVSTPIVDLQTYSPSPAGATNATPGNVAGASNATISNMGLGTTVATAPEAVVPVTAAVPVGLPSQPGSQATGEQHALIDLGAARFNDVYANEFIHENGRSLAEIAAAWREWTKQNPPRRTITNQDLERLPKGTDVQNQPSTNQPPTNH